MWSNQAEYRTRNTPLASTTTWIISDHVGDDRALLYHMEAKARLPADPGTVSFYCQSHRCSLCRRDSRQMVCAFGNEKWKYELTPQ